MIREVGNVATPRDDGYGASLVHRTTREVGVRIDRRGGLKGTFVPP